MAVQSCLDATCPHAKYQIQALIRVLLQSDFQEALQIALCELFEGLMI